MYNGLDRVVFPSVRLKVVRSYVLPCIEAIAATVPQGKVWASDRYRSHQLRGVSSLSHLIKHMTDTLAHGVDAVVVAKRSLLFANDHGVAIARAVALSGAEVFHVLVTAATSRRRRWGAPRGSNPAQGGSRSRPPHDSHFPGTIPPGKTRETNKYSKAMKRTVRFKLRMRNEY